MSNPSIKNLAKDLTEIVEGKDNNLSSSSSPVSPTAPIPSASPTAPIPSASPAAPIPSASPVSPAAPISSASSFQNSSYQIGAELSGKPLEPVKFKEMIGEPERSAKLNGTNVTLEYGTEVSVSGRSYWIGNLNNKPEKKLIKILFDPKTTWKNFKTNLKSVSGFLVKTISLKVYAATQLTTKENTNDSVPNGVRGTFKVEKEKVILTFNTLKDEVIKKTDAIEEIFPKGSEKKVGLLKVNFLKDSDGTFVSNKDGIWFNFSLKEATIFAHINAD